MIDYIEVGNVRIFEGETWKFPLAPLTIFCGTNSSGKSTLLKTLLLISQSIGVDNNFIKNYGSLKFNGSHIDLGNYESFVSNNDTNLDITIGIGLSGTILDYGKATGISDNPFDTNVEVPAYDYKLKAIYKYGLLPFYYVLVDETYELLDTVNLDSYSNYQLNRISPVLKEAKFEVTLSDNYKLEWGVFIKTSPSNTITYKAYIDDQSWMEPVLSQLKTFDQDIIYNSDDFELCAFIEGFWIDSFYFSPKSNSINISSQKSLRGMAYKSILSSYKDLASTVFSRVKEDVTRHLYYIEYVGPLRSTAKRFYSTQMSKGDYLDSSGELLPYFLKDSSYKNVTYTSLGSNERKFISLTKALNYWLYYLRTGKELPEGESGSEIEVEVYKDILVKLNRQSLNCVVKAVSEALTSGT